MIRVSDCDFTADKMSAFMMIHHVLYSKICTISLFFVIDISRSFPISDLLIISSISRQLWFIDGIVPKLNSIRTDQWFVFLSISGNVVVLFYPDSSQMTSWFLIRFDIIQNEVSLHSECTSPNTRHHRSQLSPDPPLTSDLTSILSRVKVWNNVAARIVFVAMSFSIKRRIVSHHRSRYSQRKAIIRKLQKFRQA